MNGSGLTSVENRIRLFKTFNWSFFPLQHGTKRPAVKWETYMIRRPTDEEINDWMARGYTDYAIVCGAVSNDLVILDFEDINDFYRFFSGWKNLLKSAMVVKTPHGGIHVYLHGPGIKRVIRVFGDEHPVDLLGEGGYAVAFGSEVNHDLCDKTKCNRTGVQAYELFPESEQIAREALEGAPPALTEATIESLRKRAKALGWGFRLEGGERKAGTWRTLEPFEVEKIAAALSPFWAPGSRNYFTITICGAFIHSGIGEESAKAVVSRICELKNDDDTLDERLRTVEYEYSPHRIGKKLTGLPTLREFLDSKGGADAFEKVAEVLRAPENEQKTDKTVRIGRWLLNYFDIITIRDTEDIYVRNEVGVYVQDETRLKEAIWAEFEDERLRRNDVEDILEYIRARTYADHSAFNARLELIPLRNGVLNVETMEFRPYTEDDRFTFYLPINYDPNAKLENGSCPNFQKLITEALYPEDASALQEFFGYALWRDYPEAKALVLLGEGANGKSTVIKVLKAMLGESNTAGYSLHELEANRFAKARLFGKLANIYDELPSTALASAGIFKVMTGGTSLSAEVKYGKRDVQFTNYAKFIFATNRLPRISEDTYAFFRRWIIISFPFTFSQSPKEGEKQADPELAKRIIEGEMPCVFNWAVEGLRRLKANNWAFSSSKSAEEVREAYIRSSDPVKAFLEEMVEVKSDGVVLKDELYKAYREYCERNKVPVLSYDGFFRRLKSELTNATTRKVETDEGLKAAVAGIALKGEESKGEAQGSLDGL